MAAITDPPFLWREDGGAVVDGDVARAALIERDPRLGRAIERVGPFRLRPPEKATPFQYLLKAIVYQQLSGRAAATIFGRLGAIYSPRAPSPAAVARTPPDRLRRAGLSGAKVLAVRDLAGRAASGQLPSRRALRRMDAEAAIGRLTEVRGVGRWTAEMLLLFYLGHADILPVQDLGIRKGFALVYGRRTLPTPDALTTHARRWRPYRSVACWYLWHALDPPPG